MITTEISVRALVEFILREGDIDNRRTHSTENAMQEGGRLHRKIQKSMGSEYHSEVPLSYAYEAESGDLEIVVSGRADGIIEGEIPTIDEIKGTYKRLDRLDEPIGVHLAQAKCYAFIYAHDNNLDDINVRMTYVNMETEDIRYFEYSYTFAEIEDWFMRLMKEYEKWARMESEWKVLRDDSIHKTDFPYEYRKGQKELVTHVYHTIVHGRKLFLEAPTGVGKTIATTFPAVKALGEGKANRLFYLTAKTITRTVADNAIELMRERGLHFKSVSLTAKEKICMQEECECNPEVCPYAKGHFDRINEALYDILTTTECYSRERILEQACKYQVCPFELSLDISLFCDGIICDYNYLFDPHVYLKRFFAEGKPADSIFLVDEAHNLVDRGRKMYSATLVKEDFLNLKKTIKPYDETMAKRLEKCNHELLLYKRQCTGVLKPDSTDMFIRALERLYDRMEDYLENHDASPVRDEVLDFFFEVSHFLMISELMDDKYVTYATHLGNGDFAITLYCVDPSTNLEGCMRRGVSSILFSATLLPIEYYKKLLGGNEDDYEVYAQSTFDPAMRELFIADEVTSKYSARDEDMYRRIASYIAKVVDSHHGNYMVFFPSFAFMANVQRYIITELDKIACDIELLPQTEKMTDEMREEFLSRFEGTDGNVLGFCVLGGIFGEGIDLKNESLIGAIVVGTGIPLVCDENELIKEYFDENGGDGMKYAYIYPGFNKVLQAAGRVIRTHEDRGIIALLDYRFKYSSYRELFPREWNDARILAEKDVSDTLCAFWNRE